MQTESHTQAHIRAHTRADAQSDIQERPRRRAQRPRRLLALAGGVLLTGSIVAGAAAPAHAVDTLNWTIDANTLTATQIQERHDEAYVATIAFRSTPGQVGSTNAWFHGGLSEINDIDVGELHTIPNAMGRVTFNNVTRRSLSDVLAGNNPEVIGTISIAFESDLTPFAIINSLMNKVADTAEVEIAKVVEPLSLASLVTGTDIAKKFGDAAERIRTEAKPKLLAQIGIGLASLGNPDDQVDDKVNVFVAVDQSLAALVDQEIGMNIPSSTGVGGALRPRAYNQQFTGDGASYRVAFTVGT